MKGLASAEADNRRMVFTGNANRPLAQSIANHLRVNLGKAVVSEFSDGEIMVEIMENVRGRDVFVVQPTCAPTNNNLMELLVMVDALRRASAARVTPVIPYFGYARQDRRPRSARVPITAKVVAKMIGDVGADRVLTVDLHSEQIQGFFDVPVDNVYASPILLGDGQSGWMMRTLPLSTSVVPKPMWPRSCTSLAKWKTGLVCWWTTWWIPRAHCVRRLTRSKSMVRSVCWRTVHIRCCRVRPSTTSVTRNWMNWW
jgi:hypothetical protein